ncbi:hypothetical protein FCL47_20260 [Desulfopila sp. IMCC35006]|uniref:hypothetical protein n=1 Tax=Desulfopila sp. IMCC35006 TaxID=2569542 RepID=UPI0010AD73CB|nr:hypothetical protein [Desulfopila sp. IMCC35006]TKB24001.1 hypothetical protein FCL47_20260 [Desulfopila sp. IMCC35006]
MNIIYNIGWVASLGISVFAGFNDRLVLAIFYLFASIVFLFLANLKYILKDKKQDQVANDVLAIEQSIQKAEAAIVAMQSLAKLISRAALSLIKRSGRMEGYPEEEQEALKESFLSLLNGLNLSERDREEVLEEYNRFIEIDYVYLLLESHIPIRWPREELHKRRDMLSEVNSNRPSPERIEELLIRNGSLSSNHKEILEDYKYFRKYKKYRRPEIISNYKELRKTMNL